MNNSFEKLPLVDFAVCIRKAFEVAYQPERGDAALKIYFYPFSGLFFDDSEWASFIEKDEVNIKPEKVDWIISESHKRLSNFFANLHLGSDKYLSVIVYGMTTPSKSIDVIYHISDHYTPPIEYKGEIK